VTRNTSRWTKLAYFADNRTSLREAAMIGVEILGLAFLGLCFTGLQFAWFLRTA
jgi:hypothetical protein